MKYLLTLAFFCLPLIAMAGDGCGDCCGGCDCGPSDERSSLALVCPSAINTRDGVAFAFLLNEDGDGLENMNVTLDFSATDCFGSCDATDSTGKATCSFSCASKGVKTIGILNPQGISKTAVCNL